MKGRAVGYDHKAVHDKMMGVPRMSIDYMSRRRWKRIGICPFGF